MASISNAVLSLTHDHEKKTVRAVVKCDVNFTSLEQCQMKTCARTRFFKLKVSALGSRFWTHWR